MPFLKIWIHFVWATKNRAPLLTKESRHLLFAHIKENGIKKGIHVDFVNGHVDHAHALISLNAVQTIAAVAQSLKGESAFWANKHNVFRQNISWQDDYFAVSVSESAVKKVREYIKNQEAHHETRTFQQEYEEFVEKYGFESMKG